MTLAIAMIIAYVPFLFWVVPQAKEDLDKAHQERITLHRPERH